MSKLGSTALNDTYAYSIGKEPRSKFTNLYHLTLSFTNRG